MPLYKVRAATSEGRVIAREIEAESESELDSKLEKEGLHAIEVRSGRAAAFFAKPLFKLGGVDREEFLVFNRGLMALLKAGIPVADALDVLLQKCESPALASGVSRSLKGVREGKTLSEAMAESPEAFPSLYTATIASGERTGDLVPALKGYAEYSKRMEGLRKKIIRAVSLPLVLASVSALVVVFLMLYVVPSFTKVYEGMGGEIPGGSRALFAVASVLRSYWLLMAAALVFFWFLIAAYARTTGGKVFFDKFKLYFPQIGELYRAYAISKFSRTLSMVLKSGITLVEALKMCKGVLGNSVLEDKLDYVIKKTVEGASVTSGMSEAALMPEVTLRMFAVGEKTASLGEVLSDIADFHDDEVDHKAQIIANLIEPALMIIMGLVIGTIVLLLYLPIFQIGARL